PLLVLHSFPTRRSSDLLPFAADAVVSKHLARFLCRSRANLGSSQSLSTLVEALPGSTEFVMPTAVLFNGGVFNSGPIRSRVLELDRKSTRLNSSHQINS